MAEWLNAPDCKSDPKGAVVRIHLPTPNMMSWLNGLSDGLLIRVRKNDIGSIPILIAIFCFNSSVGRALAL